MNTLLVLTNLPDIETANTLAEKLVEKRLAACASVLSTCHSIYRWKGVVESVDEVPLLIKTTEACYPALEKAICEGHPYETPEIIAVPITRGLPGYLAWVVAETQAENWLSP